MAISPPRAPKGSDALLTFVVANEEDNASTTKVEVTFPQDHPIAEALHDADGRAGPRRSTTKAVTTPIKTDEGEINEAVNTVTWTATAGGFGPGEFGSFAVSVGLPDDADSLEFKVVQTYSNGDTVDWVEPTPPGGDEPEHPAPVLDAHGREARRPQRPHRPRTRSSDDDSNGVAIAALVVGGIGLIIAIVALVMGRKKSTTTV